MIDEMMKRRRKIEASLTGKALEIFQAQTAAYDADLTGGKVDGVNDLCERYERNEISEQDFQKQVANILK